MAGPMVAALTLGRAAPTVRGPMGEQHNLTVDELLALSRDPSLKAESIAEEMECAGCPRVSPDDVQRAREKLESATAGEIARLPEMRALSPVHATGGGS